MNNKIKNIVVIFCFCALIFGIPLINIIVPDKETSFSERRKLKSFDEIDFSNFSEKFEDYSLDQFVGRDFFRTLKAYMNYNILMQKDNNKIYIVNGQVSKYNDKLDENSIINTAKKYNTVYEKYFSNMNAYYAIIPDKNYFLAEQNGYPAFDYSKFSTLMQENINPNIKYINLFDKLTIDDYYATDIHWRQEKIDNVVDTLAKEMNFTITTPFTQNELSNFHGNYYGQAAIPIGSENLVYLTNEFTSYVRVRKLDEKELKMVTTKMYDLDAYNGIDPYDVFLSGAVPLITIENPRATSDKELIILRDSFGSSLAPRLIEGYKKIILVDLRYIASGSVKNFVKFNENSDVLFINYTEILNNSTTLKVN